jgi:putative FmdB family regulatory protein
MPTYEYRCPKGHRFEHFFRTMSTAESRMKCPECGEESERLVSGGSGLVFKGSGFYITDYGKDGKKDQRKAPESKKESGSSGSDSGSSGGDSAPKPASEKPPSKGSGSSDS